MIIYHIILMSERRLVSGAFYAVRTLRRVEGDVPSEKIKRGEILQQCGSRAAASCVREDVSDPGEGSCLLMLPSSWISNGLFILLTGGNETESIIKIKKK